uniref:Transposase n=1 Tax=Rhizobium meliloti TaxID=382 RepID=I2E219_RHIML|nr:transposase [Sinorhizobium meliloti]
MRGNWLSNRVFKSYDDIVNHCCDGESCTASRGASCLSVEEKWASEF